MAVKRDKILRDAEKLVQKGRIEQAIKEYEKLLKLNPNDPNTINRIGDLYGRIGKVDKAVELYERIADHFTQDGFITKAIAILKKINRIAPDRLDIFERLADLYLQQGLLVEAKSQLQMLADWYVKNGDNESAVRVLERIALVDPGNHVVQLRLADLLLQAGEHERAVEVYDRLGNMLLAHGRLEEAERLYRHVLEANPPSGEVFLPVCRALIEAGRIAAAREFIEAAAQRCEENPEIQAYRIQLLAASGAGQEAVEAAEKALESAPDSVELLEAAGKALLSVGEGRRAKDLLVPVVDRLVSQGRQEGAGNLLRGLLQALPGDREVLERAVRVFETVGDPETLLTLKAALADACYKAGDAEKARALYTELVRLAPDRPVFRERLEQLQTGTVAGPPEAAPPAEQPVVVPPLEPETAAGPVAPGEPARETDPRERLAEASVFAKYGLVDKAIQHLQDLIADHPDLAEAREKLVALLVEGGDLDGAREVAGPLESHYRREGRVSELQSLRGLLGTAAEELEPEPEVMEEIVLEFDEPEEVAEEPFMEAPAAGAAEPVLPEREAAEHGPPVAAKEISFEPVEEPGPARPEEAGPASSEEVLELDLEPVPPSAPSVGGGVELPDLEELERSLRAEVPSQAGRTRGGGSGVPAVEDLLGSVGLGVAGAGTGAASGPVVDQGAPEPLEPPAQVEEEFLEITETVSGPSLADLEQVDFFIQQELFEDAMRLLDQLEAEYPGDPELLTRRQELKSRGVLLEDVAPEPAEAADELFAEEEEYIDLAKELEEELEAEEQMVEEATGHGRDEALLEEVFREFQKGVAEQLSEEDSDTHFNLGIAYKEMGLLPEAIGEFQISAKNPSYEVESFSMIGLCYLEQGLPAEAAEWYRKALESQHISQEARLGVLYDLGNALELAGNVAEASEAFHAILDHDASYRDASARLQRLDKMRQAN